MNDVVPKPDLRGLAALVEDRARAEAERLTSSRQLWPLVMDLWVGRITNAEVERALRKAGGARKRISPSEISDIRRQAARAMHGPLEGHPHDRLVLAQLTVDDRPVLSAWVTNGDGVELVGLRSGRSPSGAAWRALLVDLKKRGLRDPGDVVFDGNVAVREAIGAVLAPLPQSRPEEPAPEARSRKQAAVKAAIPVAVIFVWSLVASLLVFPHLSSNHDEPVYLFQADLLRQGQLTLDAPPNAEHFQQWLIGERDGKFVPKYTPVHAAFIALSEVVFRTPRLAIPLLAGGMAVFAYLFAAEVLRSRRLALLATWAVVLSPLALVLSATYLPYTSSLMLLFAFAFFVFRARRTERGWVAAGFFAGVALFARPYDAFLICAPIVVAVLWEARRSRAVGRLAAMVAGGVFPLCALLISNTLMMGSPLRLPHTVVSSDDTIGFGLRRIDPTDAGLQFGLGDAFQGFGWFFVWSLVFFAAGPALWLLAGRRVRGTSATRAERIVLASVAVFVVGYFFHWGPHVITPGIRGLPLFGPYYWLPVIGFLAVVAAGALRSVPVRVLRAAVGLSAVVVLVLMSPLVQAHSEISDDTARLRRPVEGLDDALVFVAAPYGPYLMHPFAFTRNRADFGGPVVYALARGPSDIDVMRQFPGRTPYWLAVDGGIGLDGRTDANTILSRVEFYEGQVFDLTVIVANTRGASLVELDVTAFGRMDRFVLDDRSAFGRRYAARLRLTPKGTRAITPVRDHVALPRPTHEFVITARFGGDGGQARFLTQRRYVSRRGSRGVEVLGDGLTWRGPETAPALKANAGGDDFAVSLVATAPTPEDDKPPPLGPHPPPRRRR